jgi:hypothetical protein
VSRAEETITITVKRSTLQFLFAGGNSSGHLVSGPFADRLALDIIDHAAWMSSLLARGCDNEDERNHYADQQFSSAADLVEAVRVAEAGETAK